MAYSEANKKSLEGFADATPITNEELLELEVDVLIPAAKEDQISIKNAHKIKAKIIAEGANGPITANADSILDEKGIVVIPDILANAGGVTVSYFEWVQDRQGYFWTEERVNRRLTRMMRDAFNNLFKVSEQYNVTLRQAAYIYAIDKVAKTMKLRGIYA
jgi:glutamate dehydrogenase (NAD(P)+)